MQEKSENEDRNPADSLSHDFNSNDDDDINSENHINILDDYLLAADNAPKAPNLAQKLKRYMITAYYLMAGFFIFTRTNGIRALIITTQRVLQNCIIQLHTMK